MVENRFQLFPRAMTSSIPLTAKAAVLSDFNQEYVLKEDHPVKQPSELAPGECLIKLEYSGVCHSDLHVQKGDWARKATLPLVGGHEGVGHVVAIAEHSNTTVKIGDRVGVKWIADVCYRHALSALAPNRDRTNNVRIGRCEMCRKGHESC